MINGRRKREVNTYCLTSRKEEMVSLGLFFFLVVMFVAVCCTEIVSQKREDICVTVSILFCSPVMKNGVDRN